MSSRSDAKKHIETDSLSKSSKDLEKTINGIGEKLDRVYIQHADQLANEFDTILRQNPKTHRVIFLLDEENGIIEHYPYNKPLCETNLKGIQKFFKLALLKDASKIAFAEHAGIDNVEIDDRKTNAVKVHEMGEAIGIPVCEFLSAVSADDGPAATYSILPEGMRLD